MKYTKEQLKNNELIEDTQEQLRDYPLYASTDGITRGEILALNIVLNSGLDNETPFEIIIKKIEE